MLRRLLVVSLLAGGGLALTPVSASATPLCEQVTVTGVVNAGTPLECIPYPLASECTSGTIFLGIFGKVDHQICVPAV
jgi:hypothetical protein